VLRWGRWEVQRFLLRGRFRLPWKDVLGVALARNLLWHLGRFGVGKVDSSVAVAVLYG